MTKKLILVAGETASGKTYAAKTIARLTNSALFDKDEMCKSFTESMLRVLGYEPADRESDFYINTIMPLEYKTMMLAALDNLSTTDNPVVCAAPFIDQLEDSSWVHSLLMSLKPLETDLYIIWINSDLPTLKLRMVVRSAPKDANKIKNWEEYSLNVLTSPPKTSLNIVTLNNAQSSSKSLVSQINEVVGSIF